MFKVFPLILKKEKEFLESNRNNNFPENFKKYLKSRFLPLLKIYAESYFSEK